MSFKPKQMWFNLVFDPLVDFSQNARVCIEMMTFRCLNIICLCSNSTLVHRSCAPNTQRLWIETAGYWGKLCWSCALAQQFYVKQKGGKKKKKTKRWCPHRVILETRKSHVSPLILVNHDDSPGSSPLKCSEDESCHVNALKITPLVDLCCLLCPHRWLPTRQHALQASAIPTLAEATSGAKVFSNLTCHQSDWEGTYKMRLKFPVNFKGC